MKVKPTKPDKGLFEASEEERKRFESYPDMTRLTLKEVMERGREKSKELVINEAGFMSASLITNLAGLKST